MKTIDQRQALYLLKIAREEIADLLAVSHDRLNHNPNNLNKSPEDVKRLLRRIDDFRAEFTG